MSTLQNSLKLIFIDVLNLQEVFPSTDFDVKI